MALCDVNTQPSQVHGVEAGGVGGAAGAVRGVARSSACESHWPWHRGWHCSFDIVHGVPLGKQLWLTDFPDRLVGSGARSVRTLRRRPTLISLALIHSGPSLPPCQLSTPHY